MDLGGFERDLRRLPGVVACSVGAAGVSVLLSESADPGSVLREASEIAARYGAGPVRVLESPDARPLVRRRMSPMRARVAFGTAAAAAVALVASLVPVGKRLAPKPAPPAAVRPAPAGESGFALAPVVVPAASTAPAAPGTGSASATPAVTIGAAGTTAAPDVEERVSLPAASGPRTPSTTRLPAGSGCDTNGKAHGRVTHEGAGNRSWHRHHTHAHSHSRAHWFDCT